MTVTIEPGVYQVFKERVASGKYASIEEAIAAGARLLEERDAQEQAELQALRHKIEVGMQQLERGETVAYRSGRELAEQVKTAGRQRRQGDTAQ